MGKSEETKETKTPAPAGASPTVQVITTSTKECVTEDSRGRIFTLRKPGVLMQYRLVEMLGDHAATNRAYMGMIAPLTYIATIDDDTNIVFNTKRELEALIIRLGDEGISAVQQKVMEIWGSIDPDQQAADLKK